MTTATTAQTPLQTSYPESELVFGVVAPVGVPDLLQEILRDTLKLYGYSAHVIKLSALLDEIPRPALKTKIIREPEYERINTMMRAGNEVRENAKNGAALALYAVSKIYEQREKGPTRRTPIVGGPRAPTLHAQTSGGSSRPATHLWPWVLPDRRSLSRTGTA